MPGSRGVNRGDVCWDTCKAPDKRRPVLILTRDSAIGVLSSVTIAPITSTIRSIPTEVILTEADGLPSTCAANFDNVQTVPKTNIGARIARLTSKRMREAAAAISFALALDED
jgi:mRNA interferase MazF